MSAIFISHSSKDNAIAGEVKAKLAEQGHRSIFLDFDPEDGIPAGRNWEKELYARLRGCQAVIVLCSEHSLASPWCFAEITQARSLGKHLFPLKVAACQISPLLADVQITDLTLNLSEGHQRLWSGLKKVGLDPADLFDWDGTRPPCPGLLAFQEQDAAVYFGRDAAIQGAMETLNRLQRLGGSRLVLVLGASGSGKSSLVRAGVVPRLKRDKDRWLVLEPFRPLGRPFDGLAMVLAGAFASFGNTRDWKSIRDALNPAADTAGGAHLLDLANDLRVMAGQREATVLLVVDQFEELLGRDTDQSASLFLRLLKAILSQPSSPFLAMATLRSDFLGAFQTHEAVQDWLYEPIHLPQMALADFAQVIEGPAKVAGVELEAGLAQAMVADTATDDALPLLAFTLRELWDRYSGDGRLTLEEYRDRLGGLQGSLARAAEAIFAERTLSVDEELHLRKAFLSMVRVDEEGHYVRKPACWTELPEDVHDLLERFVQARLLVSRSEGAERILEVAHEALFRSWDRLVAWLNADREFLLWSQRLRGDMTEWERTKYDASMLLRGPLLAEAERWLAERPDNLNPDEWEFIQASVVQKVHEEEEAIEQRQHAYARQLSAQAHLSLADVTARPEHALKQAIASLQLAFSQEAAEALKTAVYRLPPRHVSRLELEGGDSRGSELVFSPTGEWVVGASAKNIQVWRVSDGKRIFRQAVDGQMQLRGFTEDGHHALFAPVEQDDPAKSPRQLLVLTIDASGKKIELTARRCERLLDAIVAGQGMSALVTDAAGKRVLVLDVLSGETTGTLELRQETLLGALDPSTGDSIIIDAAGVVRRLSHGLRDKKNELQMPSGHRPVAIHLLGRALGNQQFAFSGMDLPSAGANDEVVVTQRKDNGLSILSLTTGKVIRDLSRDEANRFVEFRAAGTLLAATGNQPGMNLFGLDGQLVTTLHHSREKDWVLSQMGKIGQQDPIIGIGANDDGQILVTARKNGRVSVWRLSATPRYGAWGAFPMPDMDNVVNFDHGDELGETVTWIGPPVLSVSPTGRYVASQSMGFRLNPVGGLKGYEPLLRVWDVQQRREISRFYPLGGIWYSKFSKTNDLLLTVCAPPPERSKPPETKAQLPQIDVWRLSPYVFPNSREIERDRPTRAPHFIRIDPVLGSSDPLSGESGIAVSPDGKHAVWVGSDLKLRLWDASSDQVAIVDELAPIIRRVFTDQETSSRSWTGADESQKVSEEDGFPSPSDLFKNWEETKDKIPADFPVPMPIAISGNGRCALFGIGTTLRLYDLSSKTLSAERLIPELGGDTRRYGLGIVNLLLSDNGKYFLAGYVSRKADEEMRNKDSSDPSEGRGKFIMEYRLYSAAALDPIKTMKVPVTANPIDGQIRTSTAPLAIDPMGRFLVVIDEVEDKAQPMAGLARRLVVMDMQDRRTQLDALDNLWMAPRHPMDFGAVFDTYSAAFSADGDYVALRRTEPECGTIRSVSVTLLPMTLPSRSGVSMTYTIWETGAWQQLAKLKDHVVSSFDPAALVSAYQKESEGIGTSRFFGSSALLELADRAGASDETKLLFKLLSLLGRGSFPSPAQWSVVDAGAIAATYTDFDVKSGSSFLVTHHLSTSAQSLIEEACARMEPADRAFSPEQWATQFPGARFYPICAVAAKARGAQAGLGR